MTDEEKKAIEFLKLAKELKIVLSCSFWNNGEFEFNKLQKQQFDIVLKLVEKQQKEIEEWIKTCEKFAEERERILKTPVISKDKIREIIYPSPDNYISVEVQMSEMYRKIEELLKE